MVPERGTRDDGPGSGTRKKSAEDKAAMEQTERDTDGDYR